MREGCGRSSAPLGCSVPARLKPLLSGPLSATRPWAGSGKAACHLRAPPCSRGLPIRMRIPACRAPASPRGLPGPAGRGPRPGRGRRRGGTTGPGKPRAALGARAPGDGPAGRSRGRAADRSSRRAARAAPPAAEPGSVPLCAGERPPSPPFVCGEDGPSFPPCLLPSALPALSLARRRPGPARPRAVTLWAAAAPARGAAPQRSARLPLRGLHLGQRGAPGGRSRSSAARWVTAVTALSDPPYEHAQSSQSFKQNSLWLYCPALIFYFFFQGCC